MPKLRVPEDGLRGMTIVANLSEQQFDNFADELKSGPIEVPFQTGLEKIVKHFTEGDNKASSALVQAIQSIFLTRKAYDGKDEKFVRNLVDAIESSATREFPFPKEVLRVLDARIKRILECTKIDTAIKATQLFFERENLAGKFRILTDTRPVFGPNNETNTNAFLVLHTLKVEYQNADEIKEIFLSVDDEDLKKIIDVATRAIAKGQTLKEQFAKCGIEIIQMRNDE